MRDALWTYTAIAVPCKLWLRSPLHKPSAATHCLDSCFSSSFSLCFRCGSHIEHLLQVVIVQLATHEMRTAKLRLEYRRMKAQSAKELRNLNKRKRRLMSRARELDDNDLQELFVMRAAAKAKAKAAARKKEQAAPADGTTPKAKSKSICKYFKLGNCDKGKSCECSHASGRAAPAAEPKKKGILRAQKSTAYAAAVESDDEASATGTVTFGEESDSS